MRLMLIDQKPNACKPEKGHRTVQRFGKWSWAVACKPVEVDDIVAKL